VRQQEQERGKVRKRKNDGVPRLQFCKEDDSARGDSEEGEGRRGPTITRSGRKREGDKQNKPERGLQKGATRRQVGFL